MVGKLVHLSSPLGTAGLALQSPSGQIPVLAMQARLGWSTHGRCEARQAQRCASIRGSSRPRIAWLVRARHGRLCISRLGAFWQARLGRVDLVRAEQGRARQCSARQAWRCMSRQCAVGRALFGCAMQARLCGASPGLAGRGGARHCKAGEAAQVMAAQGCARQGRRGGVVAWPVLARPVEAVRVMAGVAWSGTAMPGLVCAARQAWETAKGTA